MFGLDNYVPDQIRAVSQAITKSNRTMIYSLSPGSSDQFDQEVKIAQEISPYVDMYRITGDGTYFFS
jgi:hypothetical protein